MVAKIEKHDVVNRNYQVRLAIYFLFHFSLNFLGQDDGLGKTFLTNFMIENALVQPPSALFKQNTPKNVRIKNFTWQGK